MVTTLIILLVLAVAMLVVRIYEIKSEKLLTISKIIRKFDDDVINIINSVDEFSGFLIRRSSVLKDDFIEKVWNFIASSIKYIKNRIDKIHDKMNGKGEIKEKGSVSFYLKSVSDHKDSVREEREGL